MGAWQRPLADIGAKGHDGGRGAKYLILPPNYQGAFPAHFKRLTCSRHVNVFPIVGPRVQL